MVLKMTEEQRLQTLEFMKARIRQSLDDPRPDLTLRQVEAHMKKFIAKVDKEFELERERVKGGASAPDSN